MANLFRGRDRRALEKMSQLLAYFARRDLKAKDPTKTQALNTRVEVFDTDFPIMGYAFEVVEARVAELLAADDENDLAGQDMEPGKATALTIGANSYVEDLSADDLKPTTTVSVWRVDDVWVTWLFSTSVRPAAVTTMLLRYTWNELAVDEIPFRVKAGEMWLPGEIAAFFNS